jgi:DNA-binding NtrC family response regulator
LLIDRNELDRQRLEALLGGFGLKCSVFAKPADIPDWVVPETALVFAAASEPDQCEEVLQFARSRLRKPVIFYTDTSSEEEIGDLILSGAADFLVKPFDKDLLRFKLEQAGILRH